MCSINKFLKDVFALPIKGVRRAEHRYGCAFQFLVGGKLNMSQMVKLSRELSVRAVFVAATMLFNAAVFAAVTPDLNALQPGQWGMTDRLATPTVSTLDPCPARNCSYSGSDGQVDIMTAWNGGAYDTNRDRLIVWGGGHNNYGGNEVYVFNIATMAWQRLNDPTITTTADRADCTPKQVTDGTCVGGQNTTNFYHDGKPSQRHTYSALAYAASVDRFFSMARGSAFGSGGSSGLDVDSFDFGTLAWKSDWQKSPGNGTYGTLAAYHSGTGKIWYQSCASSVDARK